MSEPKPCPVCGGTEFRIEFEETEGGVAAFLMCDECDENDDTQGPLGKACGTDGDAENEAILAWNRFVDAYEG